MWTNSGDLQYHKIFPLLLSRLRLCDDDVRVRSFIEVIFFLIIIALHSYFSFSWFIIKRSIFNLECLYASCFTFFSNCFILLTSVLLKGCLFVQLLHPFFQPSFSSDSLKDFRFFILSHFRYFCKSLYGFSMNKLLCSSICKYFCF
jgi:hypothetical protein